MKNRQHRLERLRLREAEGSLTEEERTELLAIFAELDAEEAEALKPGKEKAKSCRKKKRNLKRWLRNCKILLLSISDC